jgi:uncharacterized repeat protein (TIGR02543 family)
MYSAWLGTTTTGGWSRAHVANCSETSIGRISIYNTNPTISGDVTAEGRWEFINSSYNKYGLVGQTYDSQWIDSRYPPASATNTVDGSKYISIILNMGTSTSWANGTTITKRAVYIPHWQENYNLNVALTGTGTGTVTSKDNGIICGSDCTEGYLEGTVVTLEAKPVDGSVFAGWSESCSGTSPTCTVTMDATKNVTAVFNASAVATLSCNCSPQTGLSPLVVMITASGGLPPYDFNVGESGVATFLDRTSPFYYTYGSKGTKTITCTDSASTPISRTCDVTVTEPSSFDGGEVAP